MLYAIVSTMHATSSTHIAWLYRRLNLFYNFVLIDAAWLHKFSVKPLCLFRTCDIYRIIIEAATEDIWRQFKVNMEFVSSWS
jgi:hypothetical protein